MSDYTPQDRNTVREWEAGLEIELNGDVYQESAFRECSRRMLRIMNIALGELERSAAWWSVQFALGTLHCEGRTMTEVAADLGITRAAISKQATELCRKMAIPPSLYMKRESAQEVYRETRNSQLVQ